MGQIADLINFGIHVIYNCYDNLRILEAGRWGSLRSSWSVGEIVKIVDREEIRYRKYQAGNIHLKTRHCCLCSMNMTFAVLAVHDIVIWTRNLEGLSKLSLLSEVGVAEESNLTLPSPSARANRRHRHPLPSSLPCGRPSNPSPPYTAQ